MGGGASANKRYIENPQDAQGIDMLPAKQGLQAPEQSHPASSSTQTAASVTGRAPPALDAGQRGLQKRQPGRLRAVSMSYQLDATSHVAIVGAGFVGTSCAFSLLSKHTASKVTLTDVNEAKCEGEVLDLEDGGGKIEVASPEEAGQADVIVITAGRGQREGETRLDLAQANAAIMKAIIEGMKPIKETAKIIVVSNPCDPLTFIAQECAGLPEGQVFGSGTVLDSWRLRVALSKKVRVHHSSITLYVLGEHGDSQFPVPSLANIGGVPFTKANIPADVDLDMMSRASATKAYDIIAKKGHTAFGIAQAVEGIVDAILNNKKKVLPVSIRVQGRACCLSLPSVVGIHGVERVLDISEHFDEKETASYNNSVSRMEEAIASIRPILGPSNDADSVASDASSS